MQKDKKKYRLLIVEDNPGDLLIIEDLLDEQILAPVITHARDFKHAKQELDSPGARFDVILLDLSLPDKSGEVLLTEMLALSDFCPIIILTGYTNIDFSIRSISKGIYDYLLKDELTAITLYKSIIYALERRKSIAALVHSEKRYSDLFHLSPQVMWVFDVDTLQFVNVNKAAIDHYGYSEEEFLSMNLSDIRSRDDRESLKGIVDSHRDDAGIYTGQFIHRKKSGELIEVDIYSTPLQMNDRELRSVIVIDVTERNLYEQALTKAIIKTQEDERYEIGGELHDNVCQLLAATQMSLGMLRKQVNSPQTTGWYDSCKENISMALLEIRNLSHRLAPAFFDDSTLEEAFERLFADFNFDRTIHTHLHFDAKVNTAPVGRDIQLNLYRILQEQLRNIQKYAKATEVEVDVVLYHDVLKMRVADNGVGFDPKKAKLGIGLANMSRRASLFSGNFNIDSSPGQGCTISVDIPLVPVKKTSGDTP